MQQFKLSIVTEISQREWLHAKRLVSKLPAQNINILEIYHQHPGQ